MRRLLLRLLTSWYLEAQKITVLTILVAICSTFTVRANAFIWPSQLFNPRPCFPSFPIFFATCQSIKQHGVSFSCVLPVIDHEFRHNIVKVAVGPRGDSRGDQQTTLAVLLRNSLSLTGQTHDLDLFFTITDCQIVRSRPLPHKL